MDDLQLKNILSPIMKGFELKMDAHAREQNVQINQLRLEMKRMKVEQKKSEKILQNYVEAMNNNSVKSELSAKLEEVNSDEARIKNNSFANENENTHLKSVLSAETGSLGVDAVDDAARSSHGKDHTHGVRPVEMQQQTSYKRQTVPRVNSSLASRDDDRIIGYIAHTTAIERDVGDNQLNQMKEDIEKMDLSSLWLADVAPGLGGAELGTSPKLYGVAKAASFSEKSAEKVQLRRPSSGSYPFTKDGEERYERFRCECLSQAIKWHFPDIIAASPSSGSFYMPSWLSKHEAKELQMRRTRKKNNLRKFLCVLVKQTFDKMQEWLNQSSLEHGLLEKIWMTFEEFSNYEVNRSHVRCFKCRLMNAVCVTQVADQLISSDVLSVELYTRIIDTKRKVGFQEMLWNSVFEACFLDTTLLPVATCALKVVLLELAETMPSSEKTEIESLFKELSETQGNLSALFMCHCDEICGRSLHPLSCLQTMPIVGVYMSPPHSRQPSTSSSCAGSFSQMAPSSHNEAGYKDTCDSWQSGDDSLGSSTLKVHSASSVFGEETNSETLDNPSGGQSDSTSSNSSPSTSSSGSLGSHDSECTGSITDINPRAKTRQQQEFEMHSKRRTNMPTSKRRDNGSSGYKSRKDLNTGTVKPASSRSGLERCQNCSAPVCRQVNHMSITKNQSSFHKTIECRPQVHNYIRLKGVHKVYLQSKILKVSSTQDEELSEESDGFNCPIEV